MGCRHYANAIALCSRHYDISGIAMVKKAIFSYAWKHISMSNAAEPFHDYSIILEKTCCVYFCLNSVAIRSLSIFCCFCTLVKLSLKYSVHFVFVVCQVKRFGNAREHICCLCKYHKEYLPERYVFGDTWQTLYCYSIFCISSQMSRLIWNSSDISWRVYITFHENLYFMCLSCYNIERFCV